MSSRSDRERTVYIRYIHGVFGREIIEYTVIHSVNIRFWPTLHVYTVYTRCFWQGNYQIYGQTQCKYTVLTNPTYIYGIYTVFLAGKSSNIRSYTVHSLHIWFWPTLLSVCTHTHTHTRTHTHTYTHTHTHTQTHKHTHIHTHLHTPTHTF